MSSYILTEEGVDQVRIRFQEIWEGEHSSNSRQRKSPSNLWMATCAGIDGDTMHKLLQQSSGVKLVTLNRLCDGLGWDLGGDLQEDKHYQVWQKKTTPLKKPCTAKSLIDWGDAPDASDFSLRAEELTELEQWILQDRCRLITVFGMAGIGKTYLVAKLVERLQGHFERIVWRSLSPTLSSQATIAKLIRFLNNDPEMPVPNAPESTIPQLIGCLERYPTLVVLDDVQVALEADGKCREDYGALFKRVGQGRHRSCFLLASRLLPTDIREISGAKVRLFRLKGLPEQDAFSLLESYGISSACRGRKLLIRSYQGHPLALKMAAEIISNIHNGNIGEFLNNSLFIGDVMLGLLDAQFDHLSSLKQEIVKYLARQSERITLNQLLEVFVKSVALSASEIKNSLDDLLQRSLIEKETARSGEVCFWLEPIVRKYVNARFI